jgi:hypothetical protein
MEAIWKKQYSLEALVAPDQFKSYDELKTRLDYVLGIKGTPKFQDQETVEEEEQFRRENRGEVAPAPSFKTDDGGFNDPDITLSSSSSNDEEDDTLSYFQRLADA